MYAKGREFITDRQVCKNTNRVMVKSLRIQLKLRFALYGFGKLPVPDWRTSVRLEEPKKMDNLTSAKMIKTLCQAQRIVEHTTYKTMRPEPLNFGANMVDVEGDLIVMEIQGVAWWVINKWSAGPPLLRNHPASTVAIGSEDKVLVKSYAYARFPDQTIADLQSRP